LLTLKLSNENDVLRRDTRRQRQFAGVDFELSRPLQAQLDRVRDDLMRRQRDEVGEAESPRHHREKWPLYLRVIDARDAGKTFDSIYSQLLKRTSDARFVEQHDREAAEQPAARAFQVWQQAEKLMFKASS